MFSNSGGESLAIYAAVYLLPTLLAAAKKRENVGAIFAVNLVLGWTFVGWFVAFIWALTYAPRGRRV